MKNKNLDTVKLFFLFFLSLGLLILGLLIPTAAYAKKQKPILILTSYNPQSNPNKYNDNNQDKVSFATSNFITLKPEQYFKINSKIYYTIYNPQGFKSDYIKYQIVKQDNNAHVGGFTRIRNKTVRIKDKNYNQDYFTLSQTGKYFIQIFDIENLQHWLAISSFIVVE